MKLNSLSNAIVTLLLLAISPANAAIHTVDVMMVYPHHVTTVPAGRDVPARVASLITFANQAYAQSNVNIRLRLVHLKEVAIPGTGKVSEVGLNNLAEDQNIQKLRARYGADLVVLLTLADIKNDGTAVLGKGFIPLGDNGKFTLVDSFGTRGGRRAGFSITAINSPNNTFVHEIGHNMGLGHAYEQGGRGGVFDWGRGYGRQGEFATIMAYAWFFDHPFLGTAKAIPRFSSPTQAKCFGSFCGAPLNRIDRADAVTGLNAVAKQVSDFFPTKVPRTAVRTSQ
jgi:hypothetical protein